MDKVILQKIFTEDGIEIKGRRAVVSESNRVHSIVSNRYKVIQSSEVLERVLPVVEWLGLHTQPSIVESRGGAVTYFKFLGDRYQGQVQVGDIVQFGVEFFNSYDTSMPFGWHIIANQLRCTNGVVVPKSFESIGYRHVNSTKLGDVLRSFEDYPQKVNEVMATWTKWAQTPIAYADANDVLVRAIGNTKLRESLNIRYRELPGDQHTAWGLYSLLTRYATHELKSRKASILEAKRFSVGEHYANLMDQMFSNN